jgi:hypothetical protein
MHLIFDQNIDLKDEMNCVEDFLWRITVNKLLQGVLLLDLQRSEMTSATRTHHQRHRDWWPYPPVGPASWTMGTEKLKLYTIGKKLFCTGPTGSADQFFILPLPSKIHRLISVNQENEPVNIL